MNTITRLQAAERIFNYHEAKIFTVTFVKRSTGETRIMNCRKGVKKGVKGIGHSFSPSEKGLVCVFDMQKNAFRFINIETILSIKMDGVEYNVKKEIITEAKYA